MAIVLTFLVVGMTQGGVARAERSAIFGATCSDTHRLKDDPIVFPGQAGRSHLHEFTGSWSTNASSTLDSMRRSGMSCSVKGDTAGYWTPTMHDASGKLIKKGFSTAYYVGNHKDRTKIVPFPAGLKVIADMNNPAAIAADAGWHCGNARVPGGGRPDPVKTGRAACSPTTPMSRRRSSSRTAGTAGTSTAQTTAATWPMWDRRARAPRPTPSPCPGCT
jgi:hypothetical protein